MTRFLNALVLLLVAIPAAAQVSVKSSSATRLPRELAVSNGCVSWRDPSKLVKLKCCPGEVK